MFFHSLSDDDGNDDDEAEQPRAANDIASQVSHGAPSIDPSIDDRDLAGNEVGDGDASTYDVCTRRGGGGSPRQDEEREVV